MQDAGKGENAGMEKSHRLKAYAVITSFLIVLALLSFLAVPRGGGAKECMGFLLDNSKYACLSGLAVSSLNASVCGYLPGAYADPCYSQVAQRTNSSATCGRISNATAGYACTEAVAEATGNYSLCGRIGEPYASACSASIAVRLDMPSLCGGAGNATSEEECSSIIYVGRMLRRGDAGYCANVSGAANAAIANRVMENITSGAGAAFAGSSASLEALAFTPNFTYSARDFCYDLAAEKLGNATLCGMIGSSSAANLCFSQLSSSSAAAANATSNYTQLIAACSRLGPYSQTCAQALELEQAIATANATECGSLGYLSDGCYSSLAATYNDISYCARIANESARGACLGRS